MTACWVLRSGLIYFWRNMNISSIFCFSKSTSINTQYTSLWETLKLMLLKKKKRKRKKKKEPHSMKTHYIFFSLSCLFCVNLNTCANPFQPKEMPELIVTYFPHWKITSTIRELQVVCKKNIHFFSNITKKIQNFKS